MKARRFIHAGTYTTAETIIGPMVVSKDWNWMGIAIHREGWTDKREHLEVVAEWSNGRQKKWVLLVAFGVDGGDLGLTESFAQADKTPPVGALFRIRIKATGKSVTRAIHLIEDDETLKYKDQIRDAII